MKQNLVHIAIVVDDYDKAIEFYTQKLQFTLTEDTVLSKTKRWVLVTPKGANGCSLLLAKGVNQEQKSRIGNQTGGRVFLFLQTDNFERDYKNLLDNQIKIVREPSIETYGTVAVFEDIFGNLWDLIEPTSKNEFLYHSTGILKIKAFEKIALVKSELKKLRELTILEKGNVIFDIHQSIEDPNKIIIWECFTDEKAFKAHLSSQHFQDFIKLNLVELENGYATKKIE
jgi:quinol monooxygenase YgiN/predicted enzyme related to lactoylglutathione lyase